MGWEEISPDWTTSHCGVYRTPFYKAKELHPHISDILKDAESILQYPPDTYTVDSKVHMLMPGQYPCIPGWHLDMIPRDEDLKQDFTRVVHDKMYMWVSGTPLTEFKTIEVVPETWIPFTQLDEHRGTQSKEHCWRCFIRLCPTTILQPAPKDRWLRRHCQVYLDAEKFKW